LKHSLTPNSLSAPFGNYAHGVKASASGILVTSGQLGIAPDGVIPADAASQTRICMQNIAEILREGGLSLGHIVRLNAFVTDRCHIAAYMAVRDEFLADLLAMPASTLVIAAGLSRPEFVVEVEATAIF
jgi:2-iminobutanoate/2-iminopropanoate deaminase